jgi:ABC-type branched-subunit amino acid transport system substrate-binding protein
MKRMIAILISIVFLNISCAPTQQTDWAASEEGETSETVEQQPVSDMDDVLREINEAGYYKAPNVELKRDENYAGTSEEFEPFRHVQPYKEHFLEQLEYTGSGRGIAEPEHVDTVKLGFIGPIESTVSVATGGRNDAVFLGKKMLQGAQLAIEQANANGGYLDREIPFELVVKNDNGLWGASANEIIDLVYKDQVWAILGTIDGANSHIAIRVALKAEVAMMNSGNTDPTYVETNIPWVIRCMSDDRQQGYLLVDYIYKKLRYKKVGIIRSSSRYGRFGVREVIDGSRRLGRPVPIEMAYQQGIDDFSLHLERLNREDVDAIVHWGEAEDGAKILNQAREMGMEQPFFMCDRCLSGDFLEIAGDNANGVICAYPWDPTRHDKKLQEFREAFREKFNEEPETQAAHAYDGMNILIWATQLAGLNRAKVRDVLAYQTEPWPGITGDIVFSAVLDDIGQVYLARYEDDKWVYYSRGDLDIPEKIISDKGTGFRP